MIKKIVLTIFASSSLLLLLFVVLNPSFASSAPFFKSKNMVTVYENVQIKDLNENVLFNLVQTWRMKNDLPAYTKSEAVCEIALKRLETVQTDFSHDGFDSTVEHFYDTTSYDGFGENLARGYTNEKIALDEWVNSPTHRKNLDDTFFTDSCLKCSNSTCVQIFAGF